MKEYAHLENNKIVNITLWDDENLPDAALGLMDVTGQNAHIGDGISKGKVKAAKTIQSDSLHAELIHQTEQLDYKGFTIKQLEYLVSRLLMTGEITVRNQAGDLVKLTKEELSDIVTHLMTLEQEELSKVFK